MHLVIMAAGEWSRMRPFTDTTPKPLLKICGKTLIEHNIESIIGLFDEIFMVVKYKKEQFYAYFGESYMGKNIHYIEQGEAMWTGAAILALNWHIKWEFIVLSGDDLYDGEDIINLTKTPWYATLCKAVENPENFGIFTTDSHGRPTGIIENL